MAAVAKRKILVVGGTGRLGKFMVEGSAKAGNPTFALVREASLSDQVKGKTVQMFKDLGVTILHGDLYDHESLVKAIKQVDVVISAVGYDQLMDQTKIISAIKEAGNVKRFLPSEYGTDAEEESAVEPAKSIIFAAKRHIRRVVEAEGIPYTYIVSNCATEFFLSTLVQFMYGLTSPPRDKVNILGDGDSKVVFNKEEDIAAYMMRAVEDPRTLNKTLYINPPNNTLSMNEIVALWEKKIGKTLEKTYIPEEQILKRIQVSPFPINVRMSVSYMVFVKGQGRQANSTIDPAFGVEASELYPDVKYTSIEEYLSQFA
ncbi:Isoflavone reductase P3 [Hirschfeldia incana]|nr:Isoflavone reductase P3 [Hirschfeldia incana]